MTKQLNSHRTEIQD